VLAGFLVRAIGTPSFVRSDTTQTKSFLSLPFCSKSLSESVNSCHRIELVFPTSDLPTAVPSVEVMYQTKVTIIDKNEIRRIYAVRVEFGS
jgi:hypothetical protein